MAFRQTKSMKSYQSFSKVTGSSVKEQFELKQNTIHRIRGSRLYQSNSIINVT